MNDEKSEEDIMHNTEVVRSLKRIPTIDLNIKDRLGRTPLHISMMHGMVKLVELLINKGADQTIEDLDSNLPISYSIDFDRPECLALAIKANK